ncbi:MarR family winged helix-turn-helix transcriptional regulator [Jonesia quinghaiensis]|uniref:MarR family winged helix-turn-helix transcriptional regulator n=1 Tax=Jonesia quinghaiensis TaxID=262806 RepID=UPI0003F7B9C9|nr:MarR family transcriptional regulator [Jonesia quinghaiensis]
MASHTQDTIQWLTTEENAAWVAFADMFFRLPGTLDSHLQRECDLTFYEYMVLAMLSEQDDRTLGMGDLAGLTSGSLSRLSHVMKRLEKAGFVTRQRDTADKRHMNATLTETGYDKIVASAPVHVNHVRSLIFDHLSAEQVTQLHTIANTVRENLSAPSPGAGGDCQGLHGTSTDSPDQ